MDYDRIRVFAGIPLFLFLVLHRVPSGSTDGHVRRGIHLASLGIVLVAAGLILLVGWKAFFLIQIPAITVAAIAGVSFVG